MTKVSLLSKFALIHEHWRPKVVATLNGQEINLSSFVEHFLGIRMRTKMRLFLVWRGTMVIEFRDYSVTLDAGELSWCAARDRA